jgi:protein-S-isoprenylcysteine O-methyltransferase Ste14
VQPLPYTELAAGIPFFGALILFLLLEQRVRLRSWQNKGGSREDHGSHVFVVLCVVGGMGAAFALAGAGDAAIHHGRWALLVAGLLLMYAGIGFRQWAVATLGRFFTVDVRVHPGQTVVEGGPYRWVRHPAYTGMVVTLLGTGLALGNWAALAVLAVVPTIGFVVRIHFEEQALLAALGEPYRRFAAGRARLIPGLW